MMNTAIASNDMAITVPLYSSAVLIFTVLAGSLYFGEGSQMASVPAFLLGATMTTVGLLVLARDKGVKEQRQKELQQAQRAGVQVQVGDLGDDPADEAAESEARPLV